MPFQGQNSIKLETEKAFVIMISWVTKQNKTLGKLIDTVLFWMHRSSEKSFGWKPESISQTLKVETGQLSCGRVGAECLWKGLSTVLLSSLAELRDVGH